MHLKKKKEKRQEYILLRVLFLMKVKCEPPKDSIFHRSAAVIFLFFYTNKGGESVLTTS